MPILSTDEMFMQEALKQAKLAAEADEVPIGCVITHNNQIIAKAHNQVETLGDPTAHAEMIAITQATNYLSEKWLQKCNLYVTIEPCSMCAGALVLARVGKLVFGASDPKAGACGSVLNIASNDDLNHRVCIVKSIFEEQCSGLISRFFQRKRKLV